MRIFIVSGQSGEYADATNWTVCAYKDEENARAKVTELEALKVSVGGGNAHERRYEVMEQVTKSMREHPLGDPQFLWGPGSPAETYSYYQTELLDI